MGGRTLKRLHFEMPINRLLKTGQGTRAVLGNAVTTIGKRNLVARLRLVHLHFFLTCWVWRICGLTSCGKNFGVVLNNFPVFHNFLFLTLTLRLSASYRLLAQNGTFEQFSFLLTEVLAT